jgi:hypothetical protein
VAGIVLNRVSQVSDESVSSNAREIRQRAVAPLLAELEHGAREFTPGVDWFALAASTSQAR